MSSLLEYAMEAVDEITECATENNTPFSAEQTFYGVDLEVLVAQEKWVKVNEMEQGDEVLAVRLYDCDGHRSRACRTLAQVDQAKGEWIYSLNHGYDSEYDN